MSNSVSANTIAEAASLIGDVSRANILLALMGGQALTASELADHAGVTAQTTSAHLAKLTASRLLALEKQGRHRYYRLASPEIADALEALLAVAASGPPRHHPVGPRDQALSAARTCYDHIAGRLGVALLDSLRTHGRLILSDGTGVVTDDGWKFLNGLGIHVDAGQPSARPLCRTCLDWSERRPHLAGRLGVALFEHVLGLGWVDRVPGSRALRITTLGRRGFASEFQLVPDQNDAAAAPQQASRRPTPLYHAPPHG